MAKVQFNCRLPEEVLVLINAEVERLQGETEKKVSQADVVSLATVKWCSGNSKTSIGKSAPENRREAAGLAMREADSKPAAVSVNNKRSESVAQRKVRESREHAAELAESDVLARMTGRDDIEYDLENVPHRSVAQIGVQLPDALAQQRHYDVVNRKVKPLARPHGNTEPRRRREQ